LIDFFAVFDGFNDFLDVFFGEFEISPIFSAVCIRRIYGLWCQGAGIGISLSGAVMGI
jgi:hypothetical protein